MNRKLKDILVALAIFIPLIFIIVGGIMYLNGTFDGTFMKELYPAMFFGFGTGFVTFILAALIGDIKWMLLLAFVAFILTIVLWLFVSKPAAINLFIGIGLIVALINTVSGIIQSIKRK